MTDSELQQQQPQAAAGDAGDGSQLARTRDDTPYPADRRPALKVVTLRDASEVADRAGTWLHDTGLHPRRWPLWDHQNPSARATLHRAQGKHMWASEAGVARWTARALMLAEVTWGMLLDALRMLPFTKGGWFVIVTATAGWAAASHGGPFRLIGGTADAMLAALPWKPILAVVLLLAVFIFAGRRWGRSGGDR